MQRLKFYPEKLTFSVFGDSIAYGMWDLKKHGWIGRFREYLERKMRRDRKRYVVNNFSIPGNTSKDLLKRIRGELSVSEPDIVVIGIGTNDSQYFLDKKKHKIDIEVFQKNLEKIFNMTKKYTDKIVFFGFYKIDESITDPLPGDENRSVKNKFVKKYCKAAKELSKRSGIVFVNNWNVLKKGDLADGLHPNEEGHRKLFENFIRTLQKFFPTLDL